MSVVSLRRSIGQARDRRHWTERLVAKEVERANRSVLASTIATNRYERAAVELIRDRERLAKAGL